MDGLQRREPRLPWQRTVVDVTLPSKTKPKPPVSEEVAAAREMVWGWRLIPRNAQRTMKSISWLGLEKKRPECEVARCRHRAGHACRC